MNGSMNSEISGRVELCIDNVYGSVCNDRWDERDAFVICRQLGRGESFNIILWLPYVI